MGPGQALRRDLHTHASRKDCPGFACKESLSALSYRLGSGVRVRGKNGILPSDVKTYRHLTEADVVEERKGPQRIYLLIPSGKEFIIINISLMV
jgi:hypothetical protein